MKKLRPTGCCKRWLRGHVPQDQTLRLIGDVNPRVADSIRAWRDGPLGEVLAIARRDIRVVGEQLCGQLLHLRVPYFCWLITRSAEAEQALLSGLACEVVRHHSSLPLLWVVMAIDRQSSYPRSLAAEFTLTTAFALQLRSAANRFEEIAFIRGDLLLYRERWASAQKAIAQKQLSHGPDCYARVSPAPLCSDPHMSPFDRMAYACQLALDLRALAASDSMALLWRHHDVRVALASEGVFFNALRDLPGPQRLFRDY